MKKIISDLDEYNKKRDFSITGEPKGVANRKKATKELEFVIQKHAATRLHYDLRLELNGVMKSWAVTRGPSYNPADKRLAVQTEDHPMAYNKFEGIIPPKQYGSGPVMIWDAGVWNPEGDVEKDYKKGHLTFILNGTRMKGRWHLVRMHGKGEKRQNWLLIKGDDDYALTPDKNADYLERENISIISGRTIEEIQSNKPVKQRKKAVTKEITKTKSTKAVREDLQKKYGRPALATLVEFPPSGDQWLHEIKYDGYRLMAFIQDGDVVLRTRGGKDWTRKFAKIAEQLGKLKVESAVLDCEAAVLSEKGITSFSALQSALTDGQDHKIEAWFFDLLYLNGEDYAQRPLIERKKALEKLLKSKKLTHLHYSDHFSSEPGLLEHACKIGAEGLVSKNRKSHYSGRRNHDWVKSKCGMEQEFVIGGFMPGKNDPKSIGALLLGYYRDGKLAYAGKVGTGFDRKTAKSIYERLKPLEIKKSPFAEKVARGERTYVWAEPEVLCEVSFWEWTPDRHIRHASFKGLREDKAPLQVHQELPEAPPKKKSSLKGSAKNFTVEGVTISHPDREVYPGAGISKGDIATYYAKAAPFMMPFIEKRLISLLRCTETINGECFFQRAPMKGGKGHVHGLTVEHNDRKHTYMYIDNPAGLIELTQMGAIEFHGWQSRVEKINKPNQIIFDLDPSEDVPFEAVKLAALDVKNRLENIGLMSFPRLSGGKGIHVVAPVIPQKDWEAVKLFTQNMARQMEDEVPDAYISTMSKKNRKGKIFIDYLRNDFSATAIIPFSLRSRDGAPICVPLTWNDLKKVEKGSAYNLSNISKKMNKSTQRIIEEFWDVRQKLPKI